MQSAGMVLAAGGIAAANEAIFTPLSGDGKAQFNWRIIPATLVLALIFGGFEKISPPFAKGLAGLTLAAVVFLPFGNAPSPIDNASKLLGVK